MKIAFCTTAKKRTAHLERTLPQNLADNREAVFVVLDYNSSDGLPEFLASRYASIAAGRLVVYRFTEPGPFHMAHAKNLAHRLAIREGADVLVNLDADNFAGVNFDRWLKERWKPSLFFWSAQKKPRGISGRIAVGRNAFLKVGGYDERYSMWSPDDKDFNARLRAVGYEPAEIDASFLDAIRHSDGLRFSQYPEARPEEENYEDSVNPRCPIANWGHFGQGVVYRNFHPEPIELSALPTRIFGIGLHKTATRSLSLALEQLGFDSQHWKDGGTAKRFWLEMKRQRHAALVDQHQAICDLPTPLLFRELDAAYPGSKFILTLRDEQRWLDSVRRHWSYEHNPDRATWDVDFSHELHSKLYGRQDFDGETFINRYRRHTVEVREYFRQRPQDLLVMNMDEGAGWFELCGFLRQPIPDIPYPREGRAI